MADAPSLVQPWDGLEQAAATVDVEGVEAELPEQSVSDKLRSGAKSILSSVRRALVDDDDGAGADRHSLRQATLSNDPTSAPPSLSKVPGMKQLWDALLVKTPRSSAAEELTVPAPVCETARQKALATRTLDAVAKLIRIIQKTGATVSSGLPLALLMRMRAHNRTQASTLKSAASEATSVASSLTQLNGHLHLTLTSLHPVWSGRADPPSPSSGVVIGSASQRGGGE